MPTPNLAFPTSAYNQIEEDIKIAPRGAIDFARLVPVNPVSEAIESISTITVDYTGKSKLITGDAGEKLSLIGFTASKQDMNIMDIGHAIQFNLKDIRSALAGNVNSMQVKMQGAVKIGEKALYDIAMTGEIEGVSGLFGLSNIPTGSSKNQVSLATVTKRWDDTTTTANSIADDLLRGYNLAATQTDGFRPPTRLVLPLAAAQIANQKRLDGGLGVTAMQLFMNGLRDTNSPPVEVFSNTSFETSMLFYHAVTDVLRMNVAHGYRFTQPIPEHHGFSVATNARVSGLQIFDYAAFACSKGLLQGS